MGLVMRFEFATPSRIIFGQGTLKEVAPLASEMGNCALLVTGRNVERAIPLLELLNKTGMKSFIFSVSSEPTIKLIIEGVQTARQNACEVVIGMGGGSAIDTGKAISALLTNSGDIMDYLEVIGRGKNLAYAPAPCIAIPTTAGSGAEVTRNSVLTSPEHQVKVSLKSNPLTDAICLDGLKRAARSLRHAFEDGSDTVARENMAVVSLYGGLALANSKLGAVHGVAGPMGAMFPAPHGVICARLLPFVMEVNVRALRHSSQQFLIRYDEVAKVLTGKSDARAEDGIAWILDLCETLDVPALSNFGITEDHFTELVARSKKASSMKGNPVKLTDEELTEILRKAVI
jgi:alcohol dehydrogenase class IV